MYDRKHFVVSGLVGSLLLVWWLMQRSKVQPLVETNTPRSQFNYEIQEETPETYSQSLRTIDRPSTMGSLSSVRDVGVRDPYSYVHETRWVTVVVDSRDRDLERFPHPDTYEVHLSEPLRHVIRARLVTAEIPSTFYVFSQDRFNTTLRVLACGVGKIIQIPDGNYGIQEMVQVLIHALQAAFPSMGFDVVADPITHRLGIRSTTNPPQPFSIHTDDYVDGKVHWGLTYYLGFPRNTVVDGSNGRLEGSRPVILNPETYMMLDVLEFGSVQEMGVRGKSRLSGTKPFAKIPVKVQTFEYTFIDTPTGTNEMHPPIQQVDKLSVRWRFHDGTPINFEDVDHSMTLEVLCTRGRNV